MRRLYGNRIFGKRKIVREMLRELKNNNVIGILIDQRPRQGAEAVIRGRHQRQMTAAEDSVSLQRQSSDNSVRDQRLRQSTATVACSEHGMVTPGSFRNGG